MILSTNRSYYAGKPCFCPWQDLDIAYDALLTVSITAMVEHTVNVYLAKYVKTPGNIELLMVTEDNKVVTHINEPIHSGINTIKCTSNDGKFNVTVVVIDTTETEYSDSRLQISPLCIAYRGYDSHYNYVRDTNGEEVPLNNTPLYTTGDSVCSAVDDNNLSVSVASSVYDTGDIVAYSDNRYIYSFGSEPLYKKSPGLHYHADLILPDSIKIVDYTENTVILKSETTNGVYSDTVMLYSPKKPKANATAAKLFEMTDNGLTYMPERVENIGFEDYEDQLAWDETSPRHDGDNTLTPIYNGEGL